MSTLREQLIALIEPVLGGLGYELIDLQHEPGRGRGVLRLFVDRLDAHGPAASFGLEDCERVSLEVSALLDVEDPIPSAYALEVSSPGLDRVLRKRAHFERFVGARVHVELTQPRDGRRRYTGRLDEVNEAGIRLEVDRQPVNVAFAEIGTARLVP
ncbi:MAG TPA: ribosome maturation factor RimP [Steroidobacteraceae bacterium]